MQIGNLIMVRFTPIMGLPSWMQILTIPNQTTSCCLLEDRAGDSFFVLVVFEKSYVYIRCFDMSVFLKKSYRMLDCEG